MNIEKDHRNRTYAQFSQNEIYKGLKERALESTLYGAVAASVIFLVNHINNNPEEIEQFFQEHLSFLK